MCMHTHKDQPICGWIIPPRIDDFATYVFRVLPNGRLVPGKVTVGGNSLSFIAMETQAHRYASEFYSISGHTSLLNLYCIDCVSMHSQMEEPRFQYDELIILRALGNAPDEATLLSLSKELSKDFRHRQSNSPANLYHRFGAINPLRPTTMKKPKYRILNLAFLRKILSYRSSYLLSDMKVTANNFLTSQILMERFAQLVTPKANMHRFLRIRLYDDSFIIFFGLPRKIDALMSQINKILLSSHSLQVSKHITHWDCETYSKMNYFPTKKSTESQIKQGLHSSRSSKGSADAHDSNHSYHQAAHQVTETGKGNDFSIASIRSDPCLPVSKQYSHHAIPSNLTYTEDMDIDCLYEMSAPVSVAGVADTSLQNRFLYTNTAKFLYQGKHRNNLPEGNGNASLWGEKTANAADRFKISLLTDNPKPDTGKAKQHIVFDHHVISDPESMHSSAIESQSSDTITEDFDDEMLKDHNDYISSSGTENFSIYVYEPCINVDSEILHRRCRKFRRKQKVTFTAQEKATIQADSASILSYMANKSEKNAKRSVYNKKYTTPTIGLWPGISPQIYSNLKSFCASSKTREKQFFNCHDGKFWTASEEETAKSRQKNKDLSDSDLIIDLPVVSLLPVMPSKHMRKSFSRENLESLQRGIESINDMIAHNNIDISRDIMQAVYSTHRRKKVAPIIPTNRNANNMILIEHQMLEKGLTDAIKECMDAIVLQVTSSDMRKSLEIERMRRGSLEYVTDINPSFGCSSSSDSENEDGKGKDAEVHDVFSEDLLYLTPNSDAKPCQSPNSPHFNSDSIFLAVGLRGMTDVEEKSADINNSFKRRSKILPSSVIERLLPHLPPEYYLLGTSISKYKLVLTYSMTTDGRHLSHLCSAIKKYTWGDACHSSPDDCHKLVFDSVSLLLVQTVDMNVCGVFLAQPVGIIGIPNGTSSNFVFSYDPQVAAEDPAKALKVYHPTGKNTIFQVRQDDMLTFGAGGGSAIVIHADMYYVQTGQSDTYGNGFLFDGENFPRFKRQQVLNVELLSFAKLKNK